MKNELKEFGLSDNEIEIYLILLKLASSTANRISEITGIKRGTVYDNLKSLTNKGVVSLFFKNKVSFYEPVDPRRLVDLIEERKENLEKVLPQIRALKSNIGTRTGVSFYEGKKGVLSVLNDILNENKELWFYGSRKKALISLQHYPENFVQKRSEKGIKLRAVFADEDRSDSFYKPEKVSKLSKLKFLKDLDGILSNIFIYSDKVAFMTSSENPVGIIIKDENVLSQQKKIFEILWKIAKK